MTHAPKPLSFGGHALWHNPGSRLSLIWLIFLGFLALSADFWASDKPLLMRLHGQTYLLTNLFDPTSLYAYDNQNLEAALTGDDWLLLPAVPWGPNAQDKTDAPLSPPSGEHWLGTDGARRDVAARLVHGTRVALGVGGLAVTLALLLGLTVGLLAAYLGGRWDSVLTRLTEGVIALPAVFIMLAVMGVLEKSGVGALIVVIGCLSWGRIARLVRAEARRVLAMDYLAAAVALGLSGPRILVRHVLPNVLSPVLISATFIFASTLLIEASLSFLGMGVPDRVASWGGLLHGAMGHFYAWWLVLPPGFAIFATVLALSSVGETLRDAFDPRLEIPTSRG